jgi:thiamine transport system ATP-binding protein
MLGVEHATVRFGDRVAVDDVDLAVGDGEVVVVFGPSGCGKTTLLRAIAGLQRLYAGRVTWDGQDLATVAPHERHFALMFQEYALFPHRDVGGNVEFGLRMAGMPRAERARRVDDVLELVGLRELRNRSVATLSGGEQQRVALARALAVSPRLMMLDEPLGALDREWRERLLTEIRTLLERAHVPAVYVTHDHDEAFALATRVVVMRAGRVVQEGTPVDVWRSPVDAWTATFLGFGPAVDAEVAGGQLRTPWSDLRAPAGVADGRVVVVLRPDAVNVDVRGPVRGKVVRTTFAGDRVDVVVDAGAGGPMLRVRMRPSDAPEPGMRLQLSVDADAVLVYPRD